MTLHHFLVLDGKNTVKIHLIGTDVADYCEEAGYDPFRPFNDLECSKSNDKKTYEPHVNRIHKINRFSCQDIGSFIVADNRMRLFPYFRNILMNTYMMNEDTEWSLGTKSKIELFETPSARGIANSFHFYKDENKTE